MPPKRNQNFSLDRLRRFYKKNGISALDFSCKFYEDCRSKCENKRKFAKAREPYIGPKYGKPKIPRLLFLSLDPGESPRNSKERTIQYMREGNLALHASDIPNDKTTALWIHHYHPSNYGTFKKNRIKFETYAKEAAKFIKIKYPELTA